jgi:hypothetical protein
MNAHSPKSSDFSRGRSSSVLLPQMQRLLVIGLPLTGRSLLTFSLPTLTGAHLPDPGVCVAVSP